MNRAQFEAKSRRAGDEIIYGGLKAGFTEEMHAHDFGVRIMVLGGEITLIRDGAETTFGPGGTCEIPEGCMHATRTGPEGVAYIVGKTPPRPA